jgi:hypothetical protein
LTGKTGNVTTAVGSFGHADPHGHLCPPHQIAGR